MSSYEFPIGESTLVITAQWEPDPNILEAEMVKMANSFDDWSVPMREAREIMIQSTRRRFIEENDPSGEPWAPLSDIYWHDKVEVGGFPDQILVRTDAMRTAATSEHAWFVTQRAIFFNVDALPRSPHGNIYGMAHQTGAQTGETTFLPQRAFIGPDDQAVNEIEAVFLDHMDRTITVEWDEPLPPGPPVVVEVITTTGRVGKLSTGPSFGGPGFKMVHGPGGRFIGHTFIGE